MKTLDLSTRPEIPKSCPKCRRKNVEAAAFCARCHFDLIFNIASVELTGTCIYCEAVGLFSAEHVFGKWVKKKFPSEYTTGIHALTRPTNFIPGDQHDRESRNIYTNEGPFDKTVLNVCNDCNTKWMSQLQKSAAPLVVEISRLKKCNFGELQRTTLSRWIAMVSINMQCHGRQLFTPLKQRQILMKGQMPLGWNTYIGAMDTDQDSGFSINRAMSIKTANPIDDRWEPLISSCFVIGGAVFHSLSSTSYEALNDALSVFNNEVDIPLDQLWPMKIGHSPSDSPDITRSQIYAMQDQFGPAVMRFAEDVP